MMPLLIAALLGASAAIVVLYPLLGLDRDLMPDTADALSLSDDAERERSAKLALRDVTFDYRLGNLDEEDYIALRDRYERRALAALKTRYEREQALDALIDRQLDALRASSGEAGAPDDASAEAAGHASGATRVRVADTKSTAANGTAANGTAGRAGHERRIASPAPHVRRRRRA